MAKAVFTRTQHARLLDEAAQAAGQIQLLARMVFEARDDANDVDALTRAIEALAGRAGWFTEIVAQECHGGLVASDALHWLMPEVCIPHPDLAPISACERTERGSA